MFRRLLFVTCVFVCFGSLLNDASGQATPVVADLELSRIPGLSKADIAKSKTTSRKVVAYRGLLFVPYSFESGTTIVGYDQAEVPRLRRDIKGGKFLKSIEIDAKKNVVRFVGERGSKHDMPWAKLAGGAAAASSRPNSKAIQPKSSQPKPSTRQSKEHSIWSELGGALKELRGVTNSLEKSKNKLATKTRNGATGSNAIRSKLERLMNQKELSFEDVEKAQLDIASLGLGDVSQILGGSVTGGMSGQQAEQILKQNSQLIEDLRSKVSSDKFTGTDQQQSALLDVLNKSIRKLER